MLIAGAPIGRHLNSDGTAEISTLPSMLEQNALSDAALGMGDARVREALQ
jgi:hypothetical protein